jgi:hypothetical protein
MHKIRHHRLALTLPSLRLEGGLFLPDQLEKAALGQAPHQTEADYAIPRGLKLKDEYSRAFQIATAQWRHFAPRMERTDLDAAATTSRFVTELLRDAFGYGQIVAISGLGSGDRHYPINALAGALPIVIAPHSLGLDEPDPRFAVAGGGSRRKSAFQLAQEYLNASGEHLWALVCNGRQLRLLRDAATLTRPSFLEIDLQDLLDGQRYAEFALAWHLLHASRAGGADPQTAIWERWREAGKEEGTRVREGLREGVTQALVTLGAGFLAHPANERLRQALQGGDLTSDGLFQQLLRLVYRLIFLFNVEERGLLHPQDDSPAAHRARQAYAAGYAQARLRDYCLKRRARTHHADLWQAARIVFRGLDQGEPRLALPALGGLFAATQCPDLDQAALDNAHWLAALQALRWSNRQGSLAPVDYRNMGPEELGSVYESLLELVPEIDLPARRFGFIGLTAAGASAGNARKLTGSYYTPDALVQELIKSALDPVIAQRLQARPANPIAALLDIKLIDPACGSGHFLLAGARRLAEKLAQLRAEAETEGGAVKPRDYRHALREVIARCIHGVDRNPMAIELARTALWLEGYEEGRPLGFLDHHLQCGDALLGVLDLKTLDCGIPKEAFKPLSGDDKAVCKSLALTNAGGLNQFKRDRERRAAGMARGLELEGSDELAALVALEALPEETPAQIAAKEAAYRQHLEQARTSRLRQAADLLVGAFLLPKTGEASAIPTSRSLYLELYSANHDQTHQRQRQGASAACAQARVLHWQLAFPQVFAQGGFDCVLGNPPWERIKLQEEEFFATRHRDVAEARNKAERSQRIQWLAEGMLACHLYPELEHSPFEREAEQRLYAEFIQARRTAEAASVFMHVDGADGGRFPLTGVGDVNTYALFAETMHQITAPRGRAGFIVPTGIATDDSTKAFFGHISQRGRLVSLLDLENREKLFPAVDSRMKFCLLTLGAAEQAEFVFFATQPDQLKDSRRRFSLTPEEFRLINPNTLTCPVFRSERDAELTKKLYRAAPVLIAEGKEDGNPWGITFMAMMHMSNDSHLFANAPGDGLLPLYEAKMIHQFDHRWATYEGDGSRDVTLAEKTDPDFAVTPRYWVDKAKVEQRLDAKGWTKGWLMGWRDICRATDERTVIATVVPRLGVGNQMPLMLPANREDSREYGLLLANLSALTFDFIARHKTGGTHMNYFIYKQLPVFPPTRYTETDLAFIVPRILELTYTAHYLKPWAKDLGYDGPPFPFDPDRRAQLRAELDACYARLYGLTRDELRYILDPADVMGENYPSETFRVLKNNEIRQFGEYRTQHLVLRAWDQLQNGVLP